MKNVKIQIKDLFVHANMDTSEKMIIVLVSKSELNIGNYQNSRLLGYYRTVSISCSEYWTHYVAPGNGWGRQGRDRMVVGFQISAYHHYRWNSNPAEGEMYAMQHYVIKFVSELRQIGVFSPRTPVEFDSSSERGVLDATLCDNICQLIAAGWWFSPGTPVGSINKGIFCQRKTEGDWKAQR